MRGLSEFTNAHSGSHASSKAGAHPHNGTGAVAHNATSHDLLYSRCSERRVELRTGKLGQPNCNDNLRRALRDIGFSDFNDEEIWSWRYRESRVRNMELYVQFDRPTGALKKIARFQIDTSDGKRQ